MAIQLEVATLDGLSPELAGLYQPHADGKFRLDLEAADGDALSRALKAERELRKSAQHTAKETERKLADLAAGSAAVAQAQAERDAAMRAAAALRGRILDATVQDAAKAAGVHTAAIADAMRAARESFTVGDDGTITTRDATGKFTTVQDWFAQQRDAAPHWYPATASGSGAPSNRIASSGSSPGISRAQFDSMSPAQRSALAQQGIAVHD